MEKEQEKQLDKKMEEFFLPSARRLRGMTSGGRGL